MLRATGRDLHHSQILNNGDRLDFSLDVAARFSDLDVLLMTSPLVAMPGTSSSAMYLMSLRRVAGISMLLSQVAGFDFSCILRLALPYARGLNMPLDGARICFPLEKALSKSHSLHSGQLRTA